MSNGVFSSSSILGCLGHFSYGSQQNPSFFDSLANIQMLNEECDILEEVHTLVSDIFRDS